MSDGVLGTIIFGGMAVVYIVTALFLPMPLPVIAALAVPALVFGLG